MTESTVAAAPSGAAVVRPAVNLVALATSIRRCNAAYIIDPTQAAQVFEALGQKFLAQYQNATHQAVLSLDPDGRPRLTISGTRASEGPIDYRVGDLLRDLDWTPIDLGGGVNVAKGAHDGVDKLCAWAIATLKAHGIDLAAGGVQIDIEGHSLGGWQAPYAVLYLRPARRSAG